MLSLIFDTETTGLPKHPSAKDAFQPRVIEFGAALVDGDGEVHERASILINPGCKLEPIITKITGLTDEDLAEEPPFSEVWPQIRAMIEKASAAIAHNAPFDCMLIDMECARMPATVAPWPSRIICTVQEHAEEWGRRPKLPELYEHYFSEPLEQKHRALDDVLALARICKAGNILPR